MGVFGWCNDGHHEQCIRSYRPFYFETVRGKSVVVYREEERKCECPKRGCPCYVKAADRAPKKRARKRKN